MCQVLFKKTVLHLGNPKEKVDTNPSEVTNIVNILYLTIAVPEIQQAGSCPGIYLSTNQVWWHNESQFKRHIQKCTLCDVLILMFWGESSCHLEKMWGRNSMQWITMVKSYE